jgi:hypothetical protein
VGTCGTRAVLLSPRSGERARELGGPPSSSHPHPGPRPSGGWCDAPIGREDRTMLGECYFRTCAEPATTEAIAR